MEKVRIQKIIAESGMCSRRKAEELIDKGAVKVNGHPCKLGDKALPGKDIITVNGERVTVEKKKRLYYIMLHKPRGYVTTMSDELDRKCVTELLTGVPERVYPIGRLDKNSEGLLLFTNDGGFANDIMHPSRHIAKTYRVTVRPDISEDQLVQLASGVEIDGRKTAECNVVVLDKQVGRVVLQMTIYEGRNRQIRKMCEAVGLEVARLKRTAVGPLKLGMLKPGAWRELKPDELRAIRNAITKK
ncbi:MAG: rRNA pseudouridine synthase [Ruminococcus sp.]|nr:rRNA pseudouridine synthase [Ruminococcus sp.]